MPPASPSLTFPCTRHLAFVPGSGQAVSASHDTTLKVWDVEARACTSQLWGHSSLVYAAAATPGGLLASGSEDNTSRLWHLGGGPSLQVGWGGLGWQAWAGHGCTSGFCENPSPGAPASPV